VCVTPSTTNLAIQNIKSTSKFPDKDGCDQKLAVQNSVVEFIYFVGWLDLDPDVDSSRICTVHSSRQGRILKGQTPGSRGSGNLQILKSLDRFRHKSGTPAPGTGYLRKTHLASSWWAGGEVSDQLLTGHTIYCPLRLQFSPLHIRAYPDLSRVLIRYLRPPPEKANSVTVTTKDQPQELPFYIAGRYFRYNFQCG
jgi:hypothetical protein